ncbi:MAG: 3D domain-containing protein [Anaeromicrobium sp.]|jgi:uncharacterized protein YabE (DUF348 family)|uniref:3D domain-containing protein n=1 Tax=Anaeromicrobium sp. TaxID=1929132 RepID=UPI0025EF4A22|nr:3D domain-containing protein [Anaeromicrobium sp.]MCT4593769.1 3D domain-containing protein [Anaeromicrobium sp.]
MIIKHKKANILLVLVLILSVATFSYANYKSITIEDGKRKICVCGFIDTVEETLEKGKVNLNAYDKISVPLDSKVSKNMNIIINRAKPINLMIDQKEEVIMSANTNVSDILMEHDIEIGPKDEVVPPLKESIGEDGEIKIVKILEKSLKVEEEINYKSIIKYNDNMDKGKINLIDKGEKGKKLSEYKVVYKNGEEISREILAEEILVKPKDEVVEKGTALYVATSRGNKRVKRVIKMSATAYDLSYESCGKNPGDKYYGITRSGTKARPGVVAVDPRVIPLGSKLYVKSLDRTKDYGFASAEDTGGAIKGKKIDLFMKDPKKVNKYGRRPVMVYILE